MLHKFVKPIFKILYAYKHTVILGSDIFLSIVDYEVIIKLMFNCIVKAYHLHSITFGSFLLVAINRLVLNILQTI